MEPDTLDRTNTNFPSQLTALLRRALVEMKEDEFLRYYQYLVKVYMTDPVYGVGSKGGARGLLVYHLMGMGKTYLVSIALEMADRYQVIVMAPKAVQANFTRSIEVLVRRMHPDAPDIDARIARAKKAVKLVSQNAHNTVEQVIRATAYVTPKNKKPGERTGALDGAFLIVDEAHNFFRAIVNSADPRTNARELYNIIMSAKNLRLLFLTGTPIAKNPFELVPCFNMLAGREILTTQYSTFAATFLSDTGAINKALLANRIFGLVSYIGYGTKLKSDISAKASGQSTTLAEPRSDGGFPEVFPHEVIRVEMSQRQYWEYLQIRTKESEESKGFAGREAQALALPGSDRQGGSTYHVRSRARGNFAPAPEFTGRLGLTESEHIAKIDVGALPAEAFTEESAPKLALATKMVFEAPGPSIIYSQFKGIGGLAPMARFLSLAGMVPFSHRKITGGARPDALKLTGYNANETAYADLVGSSEQLFVPDRDWFMPSPIVGEITERPTVVYRPGKTGNKPMPNMLLNLHLGQRKLFITELWFLSHHLKATNSAATVLYVGAACGEHIKLLVKLFPEVQWILFDPAKFSIKAGPRVKIYNRFFEYEDAEFWSGKCDFFISDIRLSADDAEKFEVGVSEDMKVQMDWALTIKPKVAAMLKFRPPYIDPGAKVTIRYLRGRCLRQAWAPKSSTETRLVVNAADIAADKLVDYDVDVYQDWCAQYNEVERGLKRHRRPRDIFGNVIDTTCIPGFDRCPDCMVELYTWNRYNLLTGARHVRDMCITGMNTLTSALKQPLLRSWARGLGCGVGHGKFPQYQAGTQALAATLQAVYDPRTGFPLRALRETYGSAERPMRYAFITGDTTDAEQDAIEMAWNSPENVRGDIIRVLLVSQRGAEGLDLKYGRLVLALESYWVDQIFYQLAMRVARPGSHDLLPREERDVRVCIMLAVENPELKASIEAARDDPTADPLPKFQEDTTIDVQLYTKAKYWAGVNNSFLDLLQQVAIECTLMEDGKCYTCRPTNASLFRGSVTDDQRLANPCMPMTVSTVEAVPLMLDGEKYYYRAGIPPAFYRYSAELQSHIEVPRSVPLYTRLLSLSSA